MSNNEEASSRDCCCRFVRDAPPHGRKDAPNIWSREGERPNTCSGREMGIQARVECRSDQTSHWLVEGTTRVMSADFFTREPTRTISPQPQRSYHDSTRSFSTAGIYFSHSWVDN